MVNKANILLFHGLFIMENPIKMGIPMDPAMPSVEVWLGYDLEGSPCLLRQCLDP
jgi:hypothetical protein